MKLNSLFNWKTSGIFKFIYSSGNVPWSKIEIPYTLLDLKYHGNYSGKKIVSPLLEGLLESDSTLSDVSKSTLSQIIIAMYSKKWEKLYSTLSLTYNPIENYRMTETETTEDDVTSSGTNTNKITVSGTTTDNTDSDNSVYGFNSSSATRSNEGNTDRTISDSNETNNAGSSSGTSNRDIDRTLTRSGNIGVTTSQQMIESERQLWLWNFFDEVFKDVDQILVSDCWED